MTAFFNSYITSILSVGVCAFICEWICISHSKSDSLKKALSFIASLCIFISVIFPFFSQIKNSLESFSLSSYYKTDSYDEYDKSEFYSLTAREAEKNTGIMIYHEFGINPVSISIELCESDNILSVSSITVTLKSEHHDFKQQIYQFLTENGFNNPIIKTED